MPSSNGLGRLLSIAALLSLAACGDLPRPFQPDEKYLPIVRPVSPEAAELLRERNAVVVGDIVNVPAPGGPRLAAAMAVALRDQGIAADVVQSGKGLTLAGIAEIKTFPNDIEVHIVWSVQDDSGQSIGQQEQVVRGRLVDWQEGNDRLLSRIALQGAPLLAPLLNGLTANPAAPPQPTAAPSATAATMAPPGSPAGPAAASAPAQSAAKAPAKPAPAANTALGFNVAKVTGAPGDGNDSLTAGMRLALGRRGFTLFAKPDNNTFIIAGTVTLTPFDGERQKITIVWTVFDPDRKKMGDIEQSNVIPKGSLNGQWGGVAKEITVAAAEGLLNLLGTIASKSRP